MFEDALMESGGKIKTKTKYWSIATLVLNGLILAALVIWPLLHPEALPKQLMATLLVAPAPPPPPPPPPPPAQKVTPIKSEMLNNELQAPSKIPKVIKMVKESAPPTMGGVAGMEGMAGGTAGGAMGGILGGIGSGPVVKVAPPKKLNISSGVMAGNLLQETQPQYPPIAKAAHVSGTVVLQATISKAGTITNLRVESGPALLQEAALDAVRTWRYRPYLLNGEPVEVETTINVVFNLGD